MSTTTTADLDAIRTEALASFAAAGDLDALGAARTAHLGKRSALTTVQRSLGQRDPDERRTLGAAINEVREALNAAEAARRTALEDERDRVVLAAEAIDVTLPPRTPPRGALHPLSETLEAMVDVFVGLGYTAAFGPEVESEWHNFTALNHPADHPARAVSDTIYVRDLDGSASTAGPARPTRTLLRTQTSPVQARVMASTSPPVYIVAPGRVYRTDVADATHLPAFHQLEGLAVDDGLTFADLRGTLLAAVRSLLGGDVDIRLRPHHFRFTEPSCEVDAFFEGRWMELLGAGMVHPEVFRAVGYDPDGVQGFAFGMGIERIAMIRHDISDIRQLVDNDRRFLDSFV